MFVITGGGTGIGLALAKTLAQRNKNVLIIGRRLTVLTEAAKFSPLINYLCSDLSSVTGCTKIVDYLKKIPVIEGLVHNAGIITPIAPLATIDYAAWQEILTTNLNAPLFLTQALFNQLQTGRVLHVGSGAAYFPVAGWAGYCVSKAALAMLTKCWQLEYENPAVASVMPGIVDTNMQDIICSKGQFMAPEKQQFFTKLRQEQRMLDPAVVGSFLCWLMLDVNKQEFMAKEWDIYDQTHHSSWLVAPQQVPIWE